MAWIADAISNSRSSILDEAGLELRALDHAAFTEEELLEEASRTLDMLVEAIRSGNAGPLLDRWKAVGAACARRGLARDDVPGTPDLLKRAIWSRLSAKVEERNIGLMGLVDAMMGVETILGDCRFEAARGFMEADDLTFLGCDERIEALCDLAGISSAEGEDAEGYADMAVRIAEITGFPRSTILIADEGGLPVPAASTHANAIEMLKSGGRGVLSALAGVLGAGPTPVLLENGGGLTGVDAVLEAYKTPRALAVPLLSGDRLLGVLLLDTMRDGEFTRMQLDLAAACASQAGLAIEKDSLLSQMESRLKQMAAIGIVARSLTTHLDPKEQLDSLLQMGTALMRADSGVFMLAEEMFGELREEASDGEVSWASSEEFKSIARRAFDGAAIVPWHRPDDEGGSAGLPGPVEASLTAPLMVRDKAIGIVCVGSSRRGERYDNSDMELFGNFAAQAAVSLENTRLYERLQDTYLGAIGSLAAAIEARDPYTVGHSARVTQYAVAIAESMSLPADQVEDIRLAGLLHDLGKIGVPDSILNKAGRLSEEEYSAIKMHPALSMRIIEPLPHLGNIIPIIYHHHERYDGNGYMDGKAGDNIPLGARIIAVADSYEAMTSDRPYRKALSREEAVAELTRNAGSQFDPEVVTHFLGLLEKTAPS